MVVVSTLPYAEFVLMAVGKTHYTLFVMTTIKFSGYNHVSASRIEILDLGGQSWTDERSKLSESKYRIPRFSLCLTDTVSSMLRKVNNETSVQR